MSYYIPSRIPIIVKPSTFIKNMSFHFNQILFIGYMIVSTLYICKVHEETVYSL